MSIPVPGQTYTSVKTPDLSLFIEYVSKIESDGFFTVEICHPDSRHDMSEPSHELTNAEWADMVEKNGLSLLT